MTPHRYVRDGMRGITVQQPWATAIIDLGKTVENRTRLGQWRGLEGQSVAVHAGRRISDRGMTSPVVQDAYRALHGHHLTRMVPVVGAVIGVVDVVDVHPEHGRCCQPWGEWSYTEHGGTVRVDVVHIVVENPVALPVPVSCRGNLGPWRLPADVFHEVARQLPTIAERGVA